MQVNKVKKLGSCQVKKRMVIMLFDKLFNYFNCAKKIVVW